MIEREDKEWGVRLVARPVRMNPNMQIQADISNPTHKQNPRITILFNGVPVQSPFVLADALAWREALGAVIGEATSVVEQLKANGIGILVRRVGQT